MLVLVVPAFSPSAAASKPAVYTLAAAGDIGMDSLPHNNWRRVQYDNVAQLIGELNPDGFLLLGDAQHN